MRIFAFDMDGTLLPTLDSPLPEKSAADLAALLRLGDVVCLASGRPFDRLKHQLDFIPYGTKYYATANGAALFNQEGECLYCSSISMSELYRLQKRYGCEKTHVYGYDDQNGIVYFDENRFVAEEIANNEIRKDRLFKLDPYQMPKEDIRVIKIILGGEAEDNAKIVLDEYDREHFNVAFSHPCYLEFLAKGSSKGKALEVLADRLGVDKNDVYTFGDQENDLEMVKMFQGVAMGNAIDKVKAVATYITKSVDDDGVDYALREILKVL